MLAFFVCSSSVSAAEVIEVGGTGSALGTMRRLGAAFEKSDPAVRIHVQPSVGSSGAIRAVAKGALDIGLISRPLNDDERGLGLSVLTMARTPFVPIAWRSVPVQELSTGELERIYRGDLTTWPNGERIRPVLRPETETDSRLIRELSSGMGSALDAARSRPGMLMALTDQDCIEIIEKTPGSLGFSTLSQVLTEKHILKVLALNGVAPSTETLAAGTYPHAKTLSLVTGKVPSAKVRRFVDFILSPRGQKVLRDAGNIPVPGTAAR